MGQRMSSVNTFPNDRQQSQIHPKNSFDRFGDDLCGLIVSFFPLEDRFRYECVSKQFRRTVFESVVDINIEDTKRKTQRIDIQLLLKISTKCPNIQTIDCLTKRGIVANLETLNPFLYNCRNLREIYCDFHQFSGKLNPEFWPLVTRLAFSGHSDKQSLIYCHRLSHLKTESLSDVFDTTSGQLLAKNLQKLEFCWRDDCHQLFPAFVSGNPCLKCIQLYNNYSEDFTVFGRQLSRLPHLRQLTLTLNQCSDKYLLYESLRILCVNCKQLKQLHLTLSTSISLDHHLLEPLKLCHRLTHLTLNSNKMNLNSVINCCRDWPRLQCLKTWCRSILPAVQTRSGQNECLRDNDFEDLLSSSPKLKTIEIRVNNDNKIYVKKNAMSAKN